MGATKRTAQTQSATTGPGIGRHGALKLSALGRRGFTLTELLVVIAIGVLLMALLIPTGRALRAGNRALTCKSQLQQIGTALKVYYYDEGGAPPFFVAAGDTEPSGPGLMVLYELGYLGRRESLHCPRDVYADVEGEAYFESYQRYDENAAYAAEETNRYSYMSTRGVWDEGAEDNLYYRQLMPALEGTSPPIPADIRRQHRPSDEAVITWCPYHVPEIEVGNEGAYQVLFWDGSVQRFPQSIMTDPDVGPDAAWKVRHTSTVE